MLHFSCVMASGSPALVSAAAEANLCGSRCTFNNTQIQVLQACKLKCREDVVSSAPNDYRENCHSTERRFFLKELDVGEQPMDIVRALCSFDKAE